MTKYTITKTTDGYQINKWNAYIEKYVPCTRKDTEAEAEAWVTRVLAVR